MASPVPLSRRILLALLLATAAATVAAALTLVSCGGEGDNRCTIDDDEYAQTGFAFCDRGLANIGGLCSNDDRRVAEVDAWADFALRNQETLAIDEPINWVSRLGTHNAFNNWQDGYPVPNQWWSMTDQLRLGSRHFELDLHWFNFAVRLCHGGEFIFVGEEEEPVIDHGGCSPYDRLYAYAMKEIGNWMSLKENRNQILTIDFEDRSENHADEVNEPIRAYLGSITYTPAMRATLPGGRLPTFREMIDANKRFLVFGPQDQHGETWIHKNLAFGFPSGALTPADNVRLDPFNQDCWTGLQTNNHDPVTKIPRGFNVFAYPNLFAWIAEDRTPFGGGQATEINHASVARAVRCGIGIVFLDDYARSSVLADDYEPEDFRHWSGIWSWEPGDWGQRGDATVLKGQKTAGGGGSWNRWASRPTSELHRFLCGPPRSESGGDPTTWADRPGNTWRITTSSGPWAEGGLRCFEEFGEQWVFRAPVSGYMNVQASLAAEGLGDIWLNYNDIEKEMAWVINKRPLAAAGPDQTLECTANGGAVARLDGSGSSDPEDHLLKFRWTGDSVFSTVPTRDVFVPTGTRTFQVVVDDHHAGVRADSMQVTVRDTTAPVIQRAVPSRSTLSPPNARMLPVSLDVVATDTCSPNTVCRVVAITSNEGNRQRGQAAHNGPDAEIVDALTVSLRAERLGSGTGRVYSITIRCTDDAGNATERQVEVRVPHDRR